MQNQLLRRDSGLDFDREACEKNLFIRLVRSVSLAPLGYASIINCLGAIHSRSLHRAKRLLVYDQPLVSILSVFRPIGRRKRCISL